MLKLIRVALLCLFILSLPTANAVTTKDIPNYVPPVVEKPVRSPVFVPKLTVEVPEIYKMMIQSYAEKYGVKIEILTYIVERESGYNPNAIGDMNIICKRTGLPVRARGILQITECYYPEISDECAFDIKCSFDSMLPIMQDIEKCKSQWTTCRDYYKSYPQ